MRALVRHVTEYRYPEVAWDSFNELRLRPCEDGRQTALAFQLDVVPGAEIREHRDYFGTSVHHVHVPGRHRELRIEARSLVLTHPAPPAPRVAVSALAPHREVLAEFLVASPHVPLNQDWAAAFGWTLPGGRADLVAELDALTAHLYARFRYTPGATGVDTPLENFALSGVGVCQDYAHAMLAVCRQGGLPARYVSGYVYAGADFVGAEATHAWVECFVPRFGWLGLDPTNNARAGEAHVKIGHGRDYADVSPVRGVYRGGGRGVLGVEVQVQADGQ